MASEDLPANGHGGPADPKPALRRAYRAARTAFVAGLDAAARRDLETALAAVLAANLPPGLVAGYAPIMSEIDPGTAVAWPRVTGAAPLVFHAAARVDLSPGFAGIPEPAADAPRVVPDIVLVPLVAVDAGGTRLGQGVGHYDRTLAALRARRPVFAVGVAWDVQRVAVLPADPWDIPLDALATPSGWNDFTQRRRG